MKTNRFLFTAGIVLAMAFTCISAEVSNTDIPLNTNQKTSVYLHPVSLITSFVRYAVEDLYLPRLNLTGEFPFSKSNALIVTPSLWAEGSMEDDTELFMIGSGIGIRRFINGNADGFYLQLMPSVFYLKIDDKIDYAYNLNVDVLGYIGYSVKYSKINLFFDIGMGYGLSHQLSISDKDFLKDKSYFRIFRLGTENDLSYDINIGIGIPLL